MKHKKLTLAKKKQMFRGTYDEKSESKFARKKRLQERGIYSPVSPFYSPREITDR